MSATPGCPTPVPVLPCPLRQARCLQSDHARTHSVTARTTSPHQHTTLHNPTTTTTHTHAHTHLPCATRSQRTNAYVQLRSSDASDTRLPNAGASAAMPSAPSWLSATATHTYTVSARITSPCQHTTTVQPHSHTDAHTQTHIHRRTDARARAHTNTHTHTRLPCATRSQRKTAYVHRRFSDVSDTSLPNAGASAAMPSAPSSFPATTPHHTHTQRYSPHYVATPAYLHCTIPPRTRLPCVTRSQ